MPIRFLDLLPQLHDSPQLPILQFAEIGEKGNAICIVAGIVQEGAKMCVA